MTFKKTKKRNLGLLALIMMAIISVDSLRNIPIAAQYGLSLITFYGLAGLFFFFPLAWVTSKLATSYPKTGGSYIWIKEAFGPRWGHIAISLQWIYNIIWYPTIFAFITSTLASLLSPGLENSKWFILSTSLGFFWMLSLCHSRGIRMSGWMSIGSAVIGTLLPMLFIIGFAAYWLVSGHASATPLQWSALLPTTYDMKNIGFFSNILFSVLGLEVIAVHAGNVSMPDKTYPRALMISAVLILMTLVCSSLGLCIIMPAQKISLVSGLMDTLQIFFSAYHITHVTWLIGICIIIGGLGIASAWMISLARGLHVSLCVMNAPAWLQKLNKHDMPSRVLLLQAIVYSVLLSTFIFFQNINTSYWILSAITAQFALFYYILLFAAAMKLIRQVRPRQSQIASVLLPTMAGVVCILGIISACLPPNL